MLDLLFRQAQVYDGSGGDAVLGDVGVQGGRIVAVGKVAERGRRENPARWPSLQAR